MAAAEAVTAGPAARPRSVSVVGAPPGVATVKASSENSPGTAGVYATRSGAEPPPARRPADGAAAKTPSWPSSSLRRTTYGAAAGVAFTSATLRSAVRPMGTVPKSTTASAGRTKGSLPTPRKVTRSGGTPGATLHCASASHTAARCGAKVAVMGSTSPGARVPCAGSSE